MEIAVIGTGQVGSRHLQSLATIAGIGGLHAVEPAAAGQALARERIGASAGRVIFHSGIGGLPHRIDAAVISTNAASRRRLLTDLLEHCQVRYLLLEKVLFPSVADCLWAQSFLAARGVAAWVNCPRRLQPAYRSIAAELQKPQPMEIRVTGSRWGLATSAVHFLDLVLYLSRAESIIVAGVAGETIPSRHQACLEATGTVAGETDLGQPFSITSWSTGDAPVQVTIETPDHRWRVTERDSEAAIDECRAPGWRRESTTSRLSYQSELTGLVMSRLLESVGCDLPSLEAGLKSHLPFLRAWNRRFAPGANPDLEPCPIT